MGNTRTMLLLLFAVGLVAAGAVSPCRAADVSQATAAVPGATVAAGEPCGSSTGTCPCACSPLAGAWVASFSTPTYTNVQTFKFAPVNAACTRFVVNSQGTVRTPKVLAFWPDANEITEFVGTACQTEECLVEFSAIAYGIERRFNCRCNDRVAFIAVISGTIEVPPKEEPDCWDADCGCDWTDCQCQEPSELCMTATLAYYDISQDEDRDGFPDRCGPVVCECRTTLLKRVQLMGQCEPGDSFMAKLSACKGVSSGATGKAFFKLEDSNQRMSFVISVACIKDVTKAEILISSQPGDSGTAAVTLFPIPPEKERMGDVCGLLTCGSFVAGDCYSPLKGKRMVDLIKAIDEGRATVVISTKKYCDGELCGRIQDP